MGVVVEILEAGYCPKCAVVKDRVLKVAREMGVDVKVIDPVKDADRVVRLGILTSPTVVVNGKIKFAGVIPSEEKIRRAIEEEMV